MMRIALCACLLLLGGCVGTAAHIVTAPIRATSWTVDKLTTSQSEADRNRGRRERKAEARERRAAKQQARREREAERAVTDRPR